MLIMGAAEGPQVSLSLSPGRAGLNGRAGDRGGSAEGLHRVHYRLQWWKGKCKGTHNGRRGRGLGHLFTIHLTRPWIRPLGLLLASHLPLLPELNLAEE